MGLEPPKLRGASAETIGLDLIYERVHGCTKNTSILKVFLS